MSTEVKVPVLGKSITEATLGQWLKKPGEAVAADEPIASLETDKVAIEVPAPVAGVMGAYVVEEGATVNVGAVIASIEAGSGASAAAPAVLLQLHRSLLQRHLRLHLSQRLLKIPTCHCLPPCAAWCSNSALTRRRSKAPAKTVA